jgi:predicted cupin superfamily sugar epimerase
MTADEVKRLLRLEPHPREGGWFVQTYAAEEKIVAEVLGGRYAGPRKVATAIYYLLEAGSFSEMHCLQSDEIFHFYAGDAVEMLQLLPDGSGRTVVIGNDLVAGQRPQVLVERGVWQGSRLVEGGQWALLGCTVSPGFEYEDYEGGSFERLRERWPAWVEMIRALTRE